MQGYSLLKDDLTVIPCFDVTSLDANDSMVIVRYANGAQCGFDNVRRIYGEWNKPAEEPITDEMVVDAMDRFGGGFVTNLARAFYYADANNWARLKAAFPEYWAEYTDVARQMQRRAREVETVR